ncbi:FtsX-like permease family protein [Demequina sp.]|uniref:FtsX-like permease family protein n=1 Tax=Demequina sp. TaxID=2050685 RepID=UPI0025BE1516|nr:FtsX-like permease family protein [Demequina sp.]
MIRRDLRVAGFLASRSITRGNAGVTTMAIAMVAAVFVSIMFLPSLIAGASTSIEAQITDTLTGDLVITGRDRAPIDDADAYLEQVRAVDGVEAATARRVVGNQIAYGEDFNAWTVAAVDPVSYADVFTTPEHLIEGDWLEPSDEDGIVLGVGIAGADQPDLRTYGTSLKTVHVGDEVEVSLLGGTTAVFTVRGIYANNFSLTDQSAFITLAAADAAIPETDPADQIAEMFDGIDAMGESLDEASAQAASLSEGLDALADASDSIASGASGVSSGADGLASGASGVSSGADGVADGASGVAGGASGLASGAAGVDDAVDALGDSAQALADGAASLAVSTHAIADAMADAAAAFESSAGAAATAASDQAAAVATNAQAVAAACPAADAPEYCQQVVDLAAEAAAAAATASVSQDAVDAAVEGMSVLAGQSAALAARADDLSSGASALVNGASDLSFSSADLAAAAGSLADSSSDLANGSSTLANSTTSLAASAATLAGSATGLADGATTLAGQTDEAADGTSALADALEEGADSVPDIAESERDDLLSLFDMAELPAAGTASTIVVLGADGMTTDGLIAAIDPLGSDVEFQTPEQLSLAIQDQLDTFELIDSIMRVISLLVAAITVFIITYVDLSNRRRQIGIERAIGIRSTAIVTSYVFKSVLTGAVGSVVGFVLFRFAVVPMVDRHPFVFPNGPVTLEVSGQSMLNAALILLVVSAVSALIPAIQAVRMRILDAIWG